VNDSTVMSAGDTRWSAARVIRWSLVLDFSVRTELGTARDGFDRLSTATEN
jgi:hypothetical protein